MSIQLAAHPPTKVRMRAPPKQSLLPSPAIAVAENTRKRPNHTTTSQQTPQTMNLVSPSNDPANPTRHSNVGNAGNAANSERPRSTRQARVTRTNRVRTIATNHIPMPPQLINHGHNVATNVNCASATTWESLVPCLLSFSNIHQSQPNTTEYKPSKIFIYSLISYILATPIKIV